LTTAQLSLCLFEEVRFGHEFDLRYHSQLPNANRLELPKIDHLDGTMDPVIMRTCFEAFDHWASVIQRFPGRAHGHQGRNKKGIPGSLSEFYEDPSKTARRLAETAALLKAATKKMAIQKRMVPRRMPMQTTKWTTLQA
jgi:hypothetical protein